MPWTWLTKCTTDIRPITFASRAIPARAGRLKGSLVDDIDAQSPDSGNLDLDLVAALHPQRRRAAEAHAIGCAGGDDVARLQPGDGRKIFDDGCDVEDHVVRRVALHDVAVQPRHEFESLRILHDVGGDPPGPERAGR